MKKEEKNIGEFNKDVKLNGGYIYTDFKEYSCYRATKRQTDELLKFLNKSTNRNSTVLDVGCGDGTFTLELLKGTKAKKIVAFDRADRAVILARAKVSSKLKKRIQFKKGNVYNSHRMFKKDSFDIIVVRGVLHHLYDPEKAIRSLRNISKKIIVLEPNGYNPILKIIEKTSKYHVVHEEKSYLPKILNGWFEKNGYKVKKQVFFSIVPYFVPRSIAKLLSRVEPLVEAIPYFRNVFCGTNLIYYEKK